MKKTTGLMVAWALAAMPAAADDWPQWRGPDRDGKSAETGLLQEWPEGGPPLAWRASGMGAGYSSVSIASGKIFSMGDLADGQYVLALATDGGEPIWKTRVDDGHDSRRGGARSTPTVDGDRLYAVTTSGDVVCLGHGDRRGTLATQPDEGFRRLPDEGDGQLRMAL